MKFNMRIFLMAFLLLYTIFIQDAYAYIDPGTGSYMLQLLIASLVGMLFALKIYWLKIKTFFLNLFKKNGSE